nr:hypothetical protein [uncultured Methanobacterium sp.]
MDKVSGRLVIVLVFLLWAIIGLTGYFNVSPDNNSSARECHVYDSTFKINDWWNAINRTNDSITFDNRNDMPHSTMKGANVINLKLTQYADSSTFQSKYQDLKVSSDNHTVLNNANTIISGIEVKFINSTNANSTETYLDYYFQKNGKYYSINITGETYTVNEVLDNAIKNTLDMIISTIN